MSIQAMAWAIEQQEVKEPETQLVLICLANYAGADGANAFPAISRLMRDTRLSERTVRRHLRKLEQLSLIRKGNQVIAAAHIGRADRRPTVYDIVLLRGVTDAPRSITGGHPGPNGGSQKVSTGGHGDPQSVNPNPSINRKSALKANSKTENEHRAKFERDFKILTQQKKV